MAPVYQSLANTAINPVILHTGQHDAMAEDMYHFFNLKPLYKIELDRKNNNLGHLFGMMLEYIDFILENIQPDGVLVQGDTSSAFAGALAAYYHKIPVGHVEAGLRSFDEYEPFPEEKNRQLISRLARWHFVPTQRALNNLLRENVATERCFLVGNTIVDAVNSVLKQLKNGLVDVPQDALDLFRWVEMNSNNCRLVLVTAHRRESWDGDISQIAKGVRQVVEHYEDIHVVWPVHPNPIVKDAVYAAMRGLDCTQLKRVWLTNPLNYFELIWVLKHSWLVLTDSGGIQEEAATLGKPVLVLRDTTERPELVDVGGGVVIGTASEAINHWLNKLTNDEKHYRSLQRKFNPFGDGHASEHITKKLLQELCSEPPIENHTKGVRKYG